MKTSDKLSSAKIRRLLLLLVIFSAVAALDYLTGYEIRLGALYAIPVGFAAWHFSSGTGVAVAIASTGFAYWSERAAGEIFSEPWIPVVNSASRLALLLFVAFSVAYFRRTLQLVRKRVEAFTGRLSICTCCHRIDGGHGFWVDFPTYLRRNSEAEPEYRRCPRCTEVNRGDKGAA